MLDVLGPGAADVIRAAQLHVVAGAQLVRARASANVVVIVSSAGGAVALGTGGAAVGLVAGGAMGIATGVVLAPFTLGLSLPAGVMVGSSTGFCAGATAGTITGLVGGGAAGYTAQKHGDGIGRGVENLRLRVREGWSQLRATRAANGLASALTWTSTRECPSTENMEQSEHST